MKRILPLAFLLSLNTINGIAQNNPPVLKFDLGEGKAPAGFTKILPDSRYVNDKGYGIDLQSVVTANSATGKNPMQDGYLTGAQPFFFSVKLPDGNYHVKLTLGDDNGTSDAVVRAECRRMMTERIQTRKGEHKTVEFTVNIRDSIIRNGNSPQVKLKPRERDYLHWDNKLTLEFNGAEPKVNAIEITPEKSGVVTVFLAGNSTVVDQSYEPWASWGQMIPVFFKPGKVAIANYAESGETLSSYMAQKRFEKTLSLMKPGDYAFVEFGHNDQKQKGAGVGAFTSYKKDLEFFIAEVKKKGGNPVLVTSVQRRRFDNAGKIEETLGDYPAAVRQVAKEQNLPLIDLNAMTKTMYEAWGPEASIKAFVHFPANSFPNQDKELADNTHFRPFGAYEVARLVIKGIRDAHIPLAKDIRTEVQTIDPAHPDTYESFYWPNSVITAAAKPDGN